MTPAVSVIIPTRNEASRIAATIEAARAAGAAEIIVSDGGSTDATLAIARAANAIIIEGATTRGEQLNRGAAAATHSHLIFLHADTLLPLHACEAVIASHAHFGGFRVAFIEAARRLRFVAFMINLRTRLTRCPWGDQAQFTTREAFAQSGGYREIPLMEDYEFAIRMKRSGKPALLPLAVRTSGRRFLEKGLVRTAATNWRIIIAWRLGVAPERLADWYRR
ncbi:MAG TPA: TIGR04283 family arsenosugar biosynthesis glycosyltransferase [Thermoanaerobaculia bacterium]|nr:TIGR04283 family arsenosugar biosynthesis glycosyltransferase [Thermoanaerobaculia bacterium]